MPRSIHKGLIANKLPRKTLLKQNLEKTNIEKAHEEFTIDRPVITELDSKKPPKFKNDLEIQPIKTQRDGVELLPIQKEGILPAMGTMVICASTGGGKSVMICNLLAKKNMLKGFYDRIVVFCLSPCPILEDTLKLKKEDIIKEDKPELMRDILTKQKELIKTKGFKKAPKILLLLDDIAQSKTFLKSEVLTELFFASTHAKVSVWVATQSYTQLPRRIRINCHWMIIFNGVRRSELDRLADEYESPFLTKKEFYNMVKYATAEPYSFLAINNTASDRTTQFRKNFFTILRLNKDRDMTNL